MSPLCPSELIGFTPPFGQVRVCRPGNAELQHREAGRWPFRARSSAIFAFIRCMSFDDMIYSG